MDNDLDRLLEKSETLKVLYVEDNEEVREQTLKMLGDFFGDIHVAKNGLDGLELFKLHKFNLVITDINMPVMDGTEMSKNIREIDNKIPIIVMSAHNENHILEDIKRYDIAQYLFKPLNLDEFIKTLQKIYL